MKPHIIFQIIDELGITSEQKAMSAISELSLSDVSLILNNMDTWYSANKPSLMEKNKIFDYWIPSANINELQNITANLVLADSVLLVDPLYDYLCYLDSSSATQWIIQDFSANHKHVCLNCSKKILELENDELKRKITDIVKFYIRNKALIETGLLIPYVDTSSIYYVEESGWGEICSKYDEDAKNFYERVKRNLSKINKNTTLSKHLVNESTLPILNEWIRLEHIKRPSLIAVQDILLNHSVPAPSIDFLNNLSAGIFKGLLKFFKEKTKQTNIPNIVYPGINDYLSIPSIRGLRPEILLEILEDKKSSLQQFKEYLVEKTAEISYPVGSREWRAQVNGARAKMRKEIIQINRELEDAKHDYMKRQTENLTIVGLSISVALLAISGQNLDLISILQGVASGAALSSGMKNIFDSWLNYQAKVQEQKRRDVYFLWRLKHEKDSFVR